MAYREVTMIEIKEILRLWLAGVPKRRSGNVEIRPAGER